MITLSRDHFQSLISVFFIIFLIFPIKDSTPAYNRGLTKNINSNALSHIGIVSVILVTILLFRYANPLFTILFIFAAYVFIQRHTNLETKSSIGYAPIDKFYAVPKREFPITDNSLITLEEQIITKFAPIGDKVDKPFIVSEFKPMLQKLHLASYY